MAPEVRRKSVAPKAGSVPAIWLQVPPVRRKSRTATAALLVAVPPAATVSEPSGAETAPSSVTLPALVVVRVRPAASLQDSGAFTVRAPAAVSPTVLLIPKVPPLLSESRPLEESEPSRL